MNIEKEAVAWAAVLICAGLVAGQAVAAAPGKTMTVGAFAADLARAAGLDAAGGDAGALRALRARGVDLGSNPGRTLTRGDLVVVGSAARTTVIAPQSAQAVTPGQARAFTQQIQAPLRQAVGDATAQGGTAEIHISCQGILSRAGRKGIPASPANPNATVAPPCEEEPLP